MGLWVGQNWGLLKTNDAEILLILYSLCCKIQTSPKLMFWGQDQLKFVFPGLAHFLILFFYNNKKHRFEISSSKSGQRQSKTKVQRCWVLTRPECWSQIYWGTLIATWGLHAKHPNLTWPREVSCASFSSKDFAPVWWKLNNKNLYINWTLSLLAYRCINNYVFRNFVDYFWAKITFIY